MDIILLQLVNQARYLDYIAEYRESDRVMNIIAAIQSSNIRTAALKDGIKRKVLKTTEHPTYIQRKEECTLAFTGDDRPITMDSCYSVIDDSYIGRPEDAKFYEKKGIVPQKSRPSNDVSSIGFCEKEQKWYGWSHRAIEGFGIGDTGKEISPWKVTKGKKIKTLGEAKKAAIAFADSVS